MNLQTNDTVCIFHASKDWKLYVLGYNTHRKNPPSYLLILCHRFMFLIFEVGAQARGEAPAQLSSGTSILQKVISLAKKLLLAIHCSYICL